MKHRVQGNGHDLAVIIYDILDDMSEQPLWDQGVSEAMHD